MNESPEFPRSTLPWQGQRRWRDKFADAFRGVWWGVREESSCRFHLLSTMGVIVLAAVLQVTAVAWCLLLLSIAGVWTAELLNTALEQLARAIDKRPNPQIASALDLASGAVLLMSVAAASVGVIVLGPPIWNMAQGVITRLPIP
ncbi:MAG: diacylglycerol kinase [Pirellulales bacterium]